MRKECCLAIDNHEALIGVGEWMSRMRVDLMERTGGMSDFFYSFMNNVMYPLPRARCTTAVFAPPPFDGHALPGTDHH